MREAFGNYQSRGMDGRGLIGRGLDGLGYIGHGKVYLGPQKIVKQALGLPRWSQEIGIG